MSAHFGIPKHGAFSRSFIGIALILAVCSGAVWVVDAAGQTRQRVALQAVADRAALAAVNAPVALSATPRGHALGFVGRGTPINVIGKAGYLKPDQPALRPDEPVATVPESKVRDALSG
jgi:hypothetical protein